MSEYPTYLIHYGIQGQKWGVRRFQNEDGTLTPEGKEHYGVSEKQIKKFESGKKDVYDYVAKNRDVKKYLNKSESRRAFIENNKKYNESGKALKDEAERRIRNAAGVDKNHSMYEKDLSKEQIKAAKQAKKEYWNSPEIKQALRQRESDYNKAYNAYKKDAEKIISKVLGDYGKTKAFGENSVSKNTEAAKRVVAKDLGRDKYRRYR